MKNKLSLAILVLFSIIILSSLSSAWIVPDSHDWIAKKALTQAPDTQIAQIISQHYDDFSTCMSLTDYSVFFYFQSGFSTIGKQYLASHNFNACLTAVEKANKNDPAELACSYGICGMSLEDAPSHNGFVPQQIERTGLVNGIVHAPSEECVNKIIGTPQLHSQGVSALVNKYPVHRDFLIKVFQADPRASTIDVGNMMDEFVHEVSGSSTYSVGFRGFTAIPTSIHLVLLLYFLFGMITLAYLIRRKNKSLFNKISMALLIILVIFPVILFYVLYFTGNVWRFFQFAVTPYCWVAPISGYETYLNQAVSNMVNFYNFGTSAIYQIPDPAGQVALANADAGNMWKLYLVGLVLVALTSLFVWLNFRRKKK